MHPVLNVPKRSVVRPARRRATAALAATVLGVLVAAPNAVAVTEIPSDPPNGPSLIPGFLGSPASADPVRAPAIPRHPFMAANGASNVHNDGYQSDTYTYPGPLGRDPEVNSQFFGTLGLCGVTIAFDRFGRLVTTCVSGNSQELRIMDPTTLETMASYSLPPRVVPPGGNPFTSAGGAYFYVDERDRAVISTTRSIRVVAITGRASNPSFELTRVYDVSSVVPADDQINSAIPDWSGRLWFVSRFHGVVGVVDQSTGRLLDSIRLDEPIGNSFAADEKGGVYIVSDAAMYRFGLDRGGRIKTVWRDEYENSGIVKPGQFTAGSGTTPTVMGNHYVAITDNADPMNVVVYRRAANVGAGRGRVVCEQPVFEAGASATENSLIATDNSIVVENNYGYAPPPAATMAGATTTPGFERVDVAQNGKSCRTVWHSDEIAPSVVPKLSLANGLVYTITKPPGSPDAWYLTAIDFDTGETEWSRLMGTGLYYNNHYAGISIGPGGDLYIGVLGGTVRVADG